MDSPIDDIEIGSNSIFYKKRIENIQIEAKIVLDACGWTWYISITNDTPLHHLFGVAIPWQEGLLSSVDGEVTTSVSQYCTTAEQIFHDQTLLTLPMLIKMSTQDCVILGDLNSSYHFFLYNDILPFCRVTHSTSRTRDFIVSFGVLPPNQAKEYYIKKYPLADQLINKWRPILKDIEQKYSLKIIHSPNNETIERSDTLISFSAPTITQLEKYISQLPTELSKYPQSFFASINLNAIFLTRNIILKDSNSSLNCAGCVFGASDTSLRWIIIDISQNNSELLHHEIYHFLARKLNPVFAGEKEELYAKEFGKLMIGADDNLQLKNEVLKFCPDILIPNTNQNISNFKIWSKRIDQIEPLIFGEFPHNPLGMDFVFSKEFLE